MDSLKFVCVREVVQKVIQKVCHNTFGRNIHTVCVRFFLCFCVLEEEQLRGVCA